MLKLKNITKVYETAGFKQKALDDVSLTFKSGEFVSILGASGSGKTTMLNIIGGLDQYTYGDLEINGKSTKAFKDRDWDSYRNNSVGFVFQSYNLIGHISVLDNVEMGMTLSGVSKSERYEYAMNALTKVGLKDHVHKKPNQLSGGQKQRVAIARALATDPDIILADEPTGALDSHTSLDIMELIKEISKEKMVIMVTHNNKLAEQYSDRIVRLKDGQIESDSKPPKENEKSDDYNAKRTAMSFITALKLSFNNLKTKSKRTLITAFAGSIGIIGVSLVLSLSNGMTSEINSLETDQLAGLPLIISETPTVLDFGPGQAFEEEEEYDTEEATGVVPYDPDEGTEVHRNVLSDEYIEYVNDLDETLYESIEYQLGLEMNLLIENVNETVSEINTDDSSFVFNEIAQGNETFNTDYELLAGTMAIDYNEAILVLEENNLIDEAILSSLGIDVSESIDYNNIIGTEIVIAKNNDYYVFNKENNLYVVNSNLEEIYNDGYSVTIVGIVIPIETEELEDSINLVGAGVWYTNSLTDMVLEDSKSSNIVLAQELSETNIITGFEFNEYSTKEDFLKTLGGLASPVGINIYPEDYEAKGLIKDYLDIWNEDLETDIQIIYTDLSEQITSTMTTMIDMIEIVLVAFAAISLIVSSIMIGIITYVSVLERTKEIGVLRSLGASKKDIKRVFNAETIIVGFTAGLLGVTLTYLISFPVNTLLFNLMDVEKVVQMDAIQSISLIGISIVLTMVSGLIPSSIAAKKNPVEALRSE